MHELVVASAVQLARRIREREVSALEVVQVHLEHIAAVNPRVNALVQITAELALAAARAADAALARGEALGRWHDVHFTVKDVVEVEGVISAAGLPAGADFRPAADAVVVARMRAAGAILLGKTNCPRGGGGGWTDNPVYGPTNNPYQLAYSPGGSSGGEAAAVAAGMSPLGIGSDSGGSIRLPAHFCGVAGLKPTHGRIPNTGVLNHPGGLFSDPRTPIGPPARSVQDLYTALDTLRGVDDHDSGVIPMPLAGLDDTPLGRLRVAFYTDDGQATPTQETQQAIAASAEACAHAGMRGSERRPGAIGAPRAITERYWEMEQLSGAQITRLFEEGDAFRNRMLPFIRHYGIIPWPVDHRPAGPHPPRAAAHGTERADISTFLGAADPLRFNYTLPFRLC